MIKANNIDNSGNNNVLLQSYLNRLVEVVDETKKASIIIEALFKNIFKRYTETKNNFINGVIRQEQYEDFLRILRNGLNGHPDIDNPHLNSEDIRKEIERYIQA